MKTELIECICGNCGFTFDVPWLGEFSYGEFLLCSEVGELAYLNLFRDKTYDEVFEMLSRNMKTAALSDKDRSKILFSLYGRLACDFDKNGEVFNIKGRRRCGNCGSLKTDKFKIKNPPKVADINIENVAHEKWLTLSDIDKDRIRDELLESFGL